MRTLGRNTNVVHIEKSERNKFSSGLVILKMPSFKERFRPSRKYKKNKETGAVTGADESISQGSATSLQTNNSSSSVAGAIAAILPAMTTLSTLNSSSGAAHDDRSGSLIFSNNHTTDLCE